MEEACASAPPSRASKKRKPDHFLKHFVDIYVSIAPLPKLSNVAARPTNLICATPEF
jgi:hypothetical protein